MTDALAREVFNQAIAQAIDPDKVAELEVLREYFTNPAFRRELEEVTWQINNRPASSSK